MVMHARKQPRVNDGYTDRKDPHLHQWLDRHQTMQQQRGNGGKHGLPAEGGHSKHSRADSPGSQPSPRYHNKVAYLERHKDKRGSLHLAEEKVSQYLATGSIGEKAPHTYGDYEEPDTHSDGSRDGRHGQERDLSSSSSRKGESKEERDHRAEVQKTAVRVCGDWSEHISSSGKRYYYNCQTEVSQWERPKEWTYTSYSTKRPEKSRDNRGNGKSCSSTSFMHAGGERAKHSSTSDPPDGRNPSHLVDSLLILAHLRDLQNDSQWTHPVPPHEDPVPLRRAVCRDGSTFLQTLIHTTTKDLWHRRVIPDTAPTRTSSGTVSMLTVVVGTNRPGSVRDRTVTVVRGHPSDVKGRFNSTVLYPGFYQMGQRMEEADFLTNPAAIQTLQELQKALSMHIKKQQSKVNPKPGNSHTASSSTGTTSAQLQSQLSSLEQNIMQQGEAPPIEVHSLLSDSPHNAHTSCLPPGDEGRGPDPDHHHHHLSNNKNNNNIEHIDGRESPASDMSPGTSCHSPTPSAGSSPPMPTIGTSALSAAALKSQQSVGLSPALSNYYNEKLIGHVLGWHGEHLEKQAERFRQEALMVGSLHCSHVCVELKRARSRVRTAEIQSTIHEQRLMMLQQHRTEIENLKPPTTLLPS
ncbi:WW domain-containing adapter protein with coiled-coil-like [Babylonia areolata]|uniref:WW domain-containing adapter protein with coiled-coil-like n=1 Tax=Babylonia areolata TaxID=304850 RepID=UPI003FD63430